MPAQKFGRKSVHQRKGLQNIVRSYWHEHGSLLKHLRSENSPCTTTINVSVCSELVPGCCQVSTINFVGSFRGCAVGGNLTRVPMIASGPTDRSSSRRSKSRDRVQPAEKPVGLINIASREAFVRKKLRLRFSCLCPGAACLLASYAEPRYADHDSSFCLLICSGVNCCIFLARSFNEVFTDTLNVAAGTYAWTSCCLSVSYAVKYLMPVKRSSATDLSCLCQQNILDKKLAHCVLRRIRIKERRSNA